MNHLSTKNNFKLLKMQSAKKVYTLIFYKC